MKKEPTIALVQTPRADLHLRPENLHALELAGFDSTDNSLLCADDIPYTSPFPSTKFALVDHNRLLSRFTQDNPEAKVVAIIDHHDDEGFHKDTADPRLVRVPTGSCASLVARHIQSCLPEQLPSELATLLLCSILIDTGGLKPGGKAEDDDRAAASFLLPLSGLASTSLASSNLYDVPELQQLTQSLSEQKADVSALTTHDLLRRDYKEYTLTPQSSPGKPILVGLASVPLGLKPWLKRDKEFLASAVNYMDERHLAVLGVLTSFRDDRTTKKHEHGKHRREQLYIVRKGVAEGLGKQLFEGLKQSETLDLKKRDLADDYHTKQWSVPDGFKVKVWEQGNAHATRKVTAPLVKNLIENKPYET